MSATDSSVERVPAHPRRRNLWQQDGRPLVSIVQAAGPVQGDGEAVQADLARAVDLLGGLSRMVRPGEHILLKPNFNSPDPLPAATDLGFLRAAIALLKEAGATRITIGEHSGVAYGFTTRQTLERLGVFALARTMGVQVSVFDEEEWVEVELGGQHLPRLEMPRLAYEADKRIYLPCLKTHSMARFTLALKVAFGFSNRPGRKFLHAGHLEEKIAEISLAWQPDLILMDGRKAFVTKGPQAGTLVEPGVILASGDLVAIDVEGIRILQRYPAENQLGLDAWEMPQIRSAISHGLGASQDSQYVVVGDLVRAG